MLIASQSGGNFIVSVSSPNTPRPNTEVVFWIGGESAPLNIQDKDLWFKAESAPTSDTTPPTSPTNLTFQSVTDTSFTLSWIASTDNEGVTGYEVALNGQVKATPTSASASISSLTPDTLYTATVRARDAAGNWSAASTPANITTAAEVDQPEYTIFGAEPHPGTFSKLTDQPLTVASAFYTYGAAPARRTLGMRIWVPVGITVPATATCELYMIDQLNLVTDTPTQTVTMTGITPGQWNEVRWTMPEDITKGQYFWCAYNFGNGDYLHAPSTQTEFIPSNNTTLFVAADADNGGLMRSRNHVDGAGTQSGTQSHYGIDAIIDEGP